MTFIIQIYCRNTDCNVRECDIVVKNHGDYPEPTTWRCPGCGKQATVHWRQDLAAHQRQELIDAIGRVNMALYERDKSDCVPVNIMMLDSLPDSWKCQEEKPAQ